MNSWVKVVNCSTVCGIHSMMRCEQADGGDDGVIRRLATGLVKGVQ
jgi:hypothetical protein